MVGLLGHFRLLAIINTDFYGMTALGRKPNPGGAALWLARTISTA
jgi:hypothetical protein